jgi:uncharacterized protein (TIGR03089 family)
VPDRSPTVADQLLAALRADAARPLITMYDDSTGERTELSVASFANWVAKTANLLRDELGVGPGDDVALLLPPHWQSAVWLAASWAAGATVTVAEHVAVAVASPDRVADAMDLADDVVAASLHPLALPCPDPLPAGVLDFGTAVRGHGDTLVVTPAPETAVRSPDALLSHRDLRDRGARLAQQHGLAGGARLLVEAPYDEAATLGPLLDGLLAALAVDGSLVLCTRLDETMLDRRVTAERVDVLVRAAHA